MAALRTPSPEQALADFSPGLPFAVALSGGADSTALLVACARRWPGQVRAVHIHHGLQAAADDFEVHCQALCLQLRVPLAVRRVQAGHALGQSPEDAARQARYAALAEAVQTQWPEVRDVALAQHADDQIETLLIALSRGAGLPGLASMPAQWQRQGLNWHRPWLALPGAALREWLQSQGQNWVEDPSNTDEKFTRNRIRARVLPALAEALPAFRETFARSAAHAAQAQEVLMRSRRKTSCKWACPPASRLCRRSAVPARPWCCATGCGSNTAPRRAPRSCMNCSTKWRLAPPGATVCTSRWGRALSSAMVLD